MAKRKLLDKTNTRSQRLFVLCGIGRTVRVGPSQEAQNNWRRGSQAGSGSWHSERQVLTPLFREQRVYPGSRECAYGLDSEGALTSGDDDAPLPSMRGFLVSSSVRAAFSLVSAFRLRWNRNGSGN